MVDIPRPIKGDARSSIALIAGLDTDFDGDYNPLFVSGDGHIRTEIFFWNPVSLAYEPFTNEFFDISSELYDSVEEYTYDGDGNVTQIQATMLGKIKTTVIVWADGNPVSKTVTVTDV